MIWEQANTSEAHMWTLLIARLVPPPQWSWHATPNCHHQHHHFPPGVQQRHLFTTAFPLQTDANSKVTGLGDWIFISTLFTDYCLSMLMKTWFKSLELCSHVMLCTADADLIGAQCWAECVKESLQHCAYIGTTPIPIALTGWGLYEIEQAESTSWLWDMNESYSWMVHSHTALSRHCIAISDCHMFLYIAFC